MLIKDYIQTVRGLYGESDLIDDDISFDERFLNTVPVNENVYHVLRKGGTVIFEQGHISSPYLKIVIDHYAGTDKNLKCNKITIKPNKELSVNSISISEIQSLLKKSEEGLL